MPHESLDPVEWELVRADIAMEKARLRANGDWAKWEAFQSQTDARFASHAASAERMGRAARTGQPVAHEDRLAMWLAVRSRDLSFLMLPPRKRRPGSPGR